MAFGSEVKVTVTLVLQLSLKSPSHPSLYELYESNPQLHNPVREKVEGMAQKAQRPKKSLKSNGVSFSLE